MEGKVCTKCSELKVYDEFYRKADGRDGYSSQCKKCTAVKQKEYQRKNKERIKEYQDEYRRLNKDYLLDAAKEYRENNSEAKHARDKEYRDTHKE